MRHTDPRARAAQALDRILRKPKPAILGWQKSATEIVVDAPGGIGRVYITWPHGTRDIAVNRRGVPLARRLPILVVPGEPNEIVDIDTSDMAAVRAVFNNVYGTLPHPLGSHADTDFGAVEDRTDNHAVVWDGDEGAFVLAAQAGALVESVNGQTGAVVLDTDDIDEGATNLYATAANVAAIVDAAAEQTTPTATDRFAIVVSNVLQWISYTNLRNAIRDYYNTVAATLTNKSIDASANTLTNVNTSAMADDAISNAKLANMAEATFKGRQAGTGTGDAEDLSNVQALAILQSLLDALFVHLSGSETIAGNKSFTGQISISNPNNAPLATERTTAATTAGLASQILRAVSSGDMTDNFGPQFVFHIQDNAGVSNNIAQVGGRRDGADNSGRIIFQTTLAGVSSEVATFRANNDMGVGTSSPLGRMHVVEGNKNKCFFAENSVGGTPVVLIPNGTGDVTRGLTGRFVVTDGVGTAANNLTLMPGDNLDVAVGSYTMRFALNANGELTVVRQSGSGTAELLLDAVWI